MDLIRSGGRRDQIGGKGQQLMALRALGLPVPAFFVIPVGMPVESETLVRAWRELGGGPVAVRSSAVGEDAIGMSFAGQFDTVLCVDSESALLDAVACCLDSVRSERVLAYCAQHGLVAAEIRMAVVVQRMFSSHTSGVMFTVDPADPDSGQVLISAGYGLGEGVVSGQTDTDLYRVGRDAVAAEISDKGQMVQAFPEGGTGLVAVPSERRSVRCLEDKQALQLAEIGRSLESRFGVPQDVEWAIDEEGAIAVLQTRPLTGVGPRSGPLYTWDNSNIIESYAGVTTPLTFSFARNAYEVVYRQFCEVMGVSEQSIESNSAVFRAMIGLIRGRVYYRLDSWYQVLTLLPGARYNKRFMEQMMGVRKEADLSESTGSAGKLRILYLVWRMVRALGGLGRRTRQFKSLFQTAYKRYHRSDLQALEPHELVSAYRDLEQQLLRNWKAPIINDFFAMIFFGVLRKLAPERHNDLLCGESGMESTLPTREAILMAARVRENPVWSAVFDEEDNTRVLARIRSGEPEMKPLCDWLDRYLDLYGDRCMEELKLETPTLRDDPNFLMATLRNFLARPDLTVEGMASREQGVRRAAEESIRVPLGKGFLFRWVLRRARRHVRERENLRFARTRVFGLVRRIFRALEVHFLRTGLLEEPGDIFFLTVEEIFGLVEGTSVCIRARATVRTRRAEFDRYRTMPSPPDRFETRGGVHLGNPFVASQTDEVIADEESVLRGLGCAPGVVREIARVIHSPRDDLRLNGQIMVCERTDPGWVPLFPTAGGLLVERGSALSHSAIVAREFGIPTVVGIPGLLGRVEDGQYVELDGTLGTVRLDVEPPISAE